MSTEKKTVVSALLGLLLGASLCLGAFLVIDKATIDKFLPDSPLEVFIFFSSVPMAPFLAILVHELGHLFAGLLQGFRLELFVAGFLGLKREAGKIKVYLNTDIQYFGGIAATAPKKQLPDDELLKKYKIVILGGPLTSIMFGILALVIFSLTDTVFNAFWGLFGISSIGMFLATTLPEKSGLFFTDRKRYQRLSDKGTIGKIELAFLQIVNQSLVENSCKNLSLDKINSVKKDNDKIMQFWAHLFEFQYYKDNQDPENMNQSKQNLNQYKAIIPKSIWNSLKIE